MKIKVSEATNIQLDWLVAQALGYKPQFNMVSHGRVWSGVWLTDAEYSPCPYFSTNWSQGGPIIEREGISIAKDNGEKEWAAWPPAFRRDDAEHFGYGPTPLIAAMRCFCASKLGDEVDIPAELVQSNPI